MKWPRGTLNRLVEEGGWVKSVTPGVEKFDDLIRLDWNAVVETVEKARHELTQHITCGRRQCAGEFNEMLKELKNFAADVERWARGEIRGEEADEFYRKARKYLAPALALLLLQNAGTAEERRSALWHFGLIFAAAVAGDGTVARRSVQLTSGEGGAALLWLAALKKAGFVPRLRAAGSKYYLEFTGGNAVALAAVMPAAGLNPKAEKAVNMFRKETEKGNVDVKLVDVQKTKEGAVATINVKAGPWEEEYRAYLKEREVVLEFNSTDVDRVHQKAHVLRLLGVRAEPKKKRNVWYISVSTNTLADRRVLPKFREVLAEAVERAMRNGWVDAEKAEWWIKKLREGVTVAEDKPMFKIQVVDNSLAIVYHAISGERLKQYVKQLEELGLEKGIHFTVKQPEDGKKGHLRITVEGVRKLEELVRHAEDPEIRAKAEQWLNHLLERARESGGEEARKKLEELVEEGAARGALTLVGVHEVEMQGRRHSVVVREAKAWPDGDKLRIHVKAVVDGVEVEREFVFFRNRDRVRGYVVTRTDVPGGREADLKRLKATSKVIFGEVGALRSGGKQLAYTRRHLEHATSFEELKPSIERWFKSTSSPNPYIK